MRPDQTRRAVLDTALNLVGSGDLSRVTVARLTQRSGVSNGSIYHHFSSREGVLRALLVECFAELVASLGGALDDRPAEECLRDLVRRHLAWVASNPGKAVVLYRVPLDATVLSGDASTAQTVALKDAAAAPLLGWLHRAQAAGAVRVVPDWAVDPIVFGPVHEAARRGLTGPEEVDVVADVVWAALRPT